MAVRLERVVLDLDDKFSGPATRAAAAAGLLHREVDGINTSGKEAGRTLSTDAVRGVDSVGNSARRAGPDIDRFSGRLRLIADAVAILGPGLIPIGAVGIPAVMGLAAQMGAAALATGTAILAFQGVGDTLKAVNDAALEPSAENLEAARIAMQNLSPQARELVREIQSLRPAFDELRNSAAAGLFPGLVDALDEMQGVLPQIEQILHRVGDATGDFARDAAESLAGPRWEEFLQFLETDIPPALTSLGRTVGNLAHGMAELWMAFDPLNDDFGGWMLNASRGFDSWAQGLSKTEGFRDFVEYVRTTGPQVADAAAAIGRALLDIVEAAAPMGGPVLEGLSAVARAISAVADSGAGPAIMASVTALALLNRGMRAFEAIKTSSLFAGLGSSAADAGGKMTGMQRAAAGLAGALAGLAIVDALQGGLEDHTIGVESMTSSLLDLQSASGDMPANLDGLANSIDRLANPGHAEALQDKISNVLGGIGNEEEYDRAVAQIESLDAALTQMVQQGNVGQAENVLENLGLNEAQMADLMSLLPGYRDALAGVENQSRQTGAAGEHAGRRAARGFSVAKSAAEDFRAELERVNGLLEKRASLRDYEQAVDDLAKTLRETDHRARLLNKNGTINIDLPKGREVQEALDNIASTAVKVTENMRGTQKVQVLTQARRDLIETARKFGLPRSAIQDLLGMLHTLSGTTARPQIIVDTARVDAQLASVRAGLSNIPDEEVWVTVRKRGTGMGAVGGADGMTVPGSRWPYGDKVLSHLAPGEEVISNRFGQADRHRELLKAINGNRYADGGTVGGRWHSAPTSTVRVVERVVERMPGQVTLTIPGMGRLVADVADRRISDARTYSDRLDDRD